MNEVVLHSIVISDTFDNVESEFGSAIGKLVSEESYITVTACFFPV
jgi:hypothetical protein